MARGEWDPNCPFPDGLVTPVHVGTRDGPTRGQAAGAGWRRTSKGLYVPVTAPDCVGQRIIEAAARLPAGGAVTGWAALRLRGASYFDGLDPDGRTVQPVALVPGAEGSLRSDAGVRISREPLGPEEVVAVHGVPCTSARRALFDEMRRVDLRGAVVAMDMTAAARLVAVWQMEEYVAAHRRWRRATQVARALTLASESSRSPGESRLRLVWELDAGLSRPLCNQPIFDLAGRHLGTADLLDAEAGVVGEYDGAVHLGSTRRSRDLGRESGYRDAGLEYVAVVGADMHDTDGVVKRIHAAFGRAAPRRASRRWTLEEPEGWESSLTWGEELRLKEWLHGQEQW